MPTTPINDTSPRVQIVSGGESSFTFPFWLARAEHLDVYINGTVKTLGLDYTVNGFEQDSGGTVTIATAPGDVVTIVRDTVKERLIGFTDPAGITARALNLELGLLLCMLQELQLLLSLGLQFPVTVGNGVSSILPAPASNKVLGWNGASTALENKDAIIGTTLPSFVGNAREIVRVNPAETTLEYQIPQDTRRQLLNEVRAVVASVDTAGDTLTTSTVHGLATGDLIRFRAVEGGVLPAPVVETSQYAVRALSTTQIALFATRLDAQNNTSRLNLTTAGSGRIELVGQPASLKDGDIWIDNALRVRLGGVTCDLAEILSGLARPPFYMAGGVPVNTSGTVITVARIDCRDQTNDINIFRATSTTANLTTTGKGGILASANQTGTVGITNASTAVTGTGTSFTTVFVVGDVITVSGQTPRVITAIGSNTSLTVDTAYATTTSGLTFVRGGRANNAWLHLYALWDGFTATLGLSTRSVATGQTLVDIPADVTHTRQMPFSIKLNGSASLYPFSVAGWRSGTPTVWYRDSYVGATPSLSPYVLLDWTATMATSWTAVQTASMVPVTSRQARLWVRASSANSALAYLRRTGSGDTGHWYSSFSSGTATLGGIQLDFPLSATGTLEYQVTNATNANIGIAVEGYTMTEVP
jgi:hypothetical protein